MQKTASFKRTVESLDALLTQLNLEGATLSYIEVTGAETFARAIAKIAPILMLVGMGGLWLEFKTPGFGLFGLLGALALLLFSLGTTLPDSPAWRMSYFLFSVFSLSGLKYL